MPAFRFQLSLVALAVSAWLAGFAVVARAESPCARASDRIPPRRADAPTGSAFARAMAALDERQRDAAIRRELLRGNLPAFLRAAVPVDVDGRAADGAAVRVTLCVLPDYLAVGDDHDFLHLPMGLPSALDVAAAFGFVLPTRHIVDVVYRQAPVRLAPAPLPAGDTMRSTAYYVRHDAMVRAQRQAVDAPPDALTSGHKKDLVLSNRLWQLPGRVAIYGWHRGLAAPIQPLSLVHGARYADYSHGVRLVGERVLVDGRSRSIYDVLRDARLASVLSDEGPMPRLAELRGEAAH